MINPKARPIHKDALIPYLLLLGVHHGEVFPNSLWFRQKVRKKIDILSAFDKGFDAFDTRRDTVFRPGIGPYDFIPQRAAGSAEGLAVPPNPRSDRNPVHLLSIHCPEQPFAFCHLRHRRIVPLDARLRQKPCAYIIKHEKESAYAMD